MPEADPYYQDLPPVADVDQWAAIIGCHPQSLRRAIHSGQIEAVRLGRLLKIPRHAVVEWLRNGAVDRQS